MSLLYSAKEISQIGEFSANIFVLAGGTDERALAMASALGAKTNHISEVLLLKYDCVGLQRDTYKNN